MPTVTQDSKESNPTNQNAGWIRLTSATTGGAVAGWGCFAFEGLKKKAQSGQLYVWTPYELMRGSSSFAASVAATTLAQDTFDSALKRIPGYNSNSVAHNAGIAALSGMLGAIVGSAPVENTILTQQLHKVGPVKAVKIMLASGVTTPWRGLPELMVREAGFGFTWLFGSKAAHNYILTHTNNPHLALMAQVGVGIAGATLTQPADVIATRKQKFKLSTIEAVQQIYNEGGVRGFYNGLPWRWLLFTGCMLTIPYAEEKISKALPVAQAKLSDLFQRTRTALNRHRLLAPATTAATPPQDTAATASATPSTTPARNP